MVSHLDGRDPCALRKYMATCASAAGDERNDAAGAPASAGTSAVASEAGLVADEQERPAPAEAEPSGEAAAAGAAARPSRAFRSCGECCGCIVLREAGRERGAQVRATLRVQPVPGGVPRGYCGCSGGASPSRGGGRVALELACLTLASSTHPGRLQSTCPE